VSLLLSADTRTTGTRSPSSAPRPPLHLQNPLPRAGRGRPRRVLDDQCFVQPQLGDLRAKSRLNLLVAGTEHAIVMVESGAQEISEPDMVRALVAGHETIKEIWQLQKRLRDQMASAGEARAKRTLARKEIDPALVAEIEGALAGPLLEAMKTPASWSRTPG